MVCDYLLPTVGIHLIFFMNHKSHCKFQIWSEHFSKSQVIENLFKRTYISNGNLFASFEISSKIQNEWNGWNEWMKMNKMDEMDVIWSSV